MKEFLIIFWRVCQIFLTLPFCLLVTVFFHELFHLFAALLVGIKVDIFSLGFGKVIWKKKIKNIKCQICCIPFGGYVKLEGEDNPQVLGWLKVRYSKKLFVVLAGVFANLLIALLCYWLNFNSISQGLYIDWLIIKATFTKNIELMYLIFNLNPNLFLIQLSVLNISCFILNLIPLPALDGGYIWLLWLEKIYKESFPYVLKKITTEAFKIIMLIQIIIILYIYLI